jgi:hypothetical protein
MDQNMAMPLSESGGWMIISIALLFSMCLAQRARKRGFVKQIKEEWIEMRCSYFRQVNKLSCSFSYLLSSGGSFLMSRTASLFGSHQFPYLLF